MKNLALEVKVVFVDHKSSFVEEDSYTEDSDFINRIIDRWSNIANLCHWFSISFGRYMHRESTDMGDNLYQAVEVFIYTDRKFDFVHVHDALNFIDAYSKLWKPYSYTYSIT